MDFFDKCFCCDLSACKGRCCIEGDSGAPLEEGEAKKLEEVLPVIWNDLSEKAKEVIKKQGVSYVDIEGDEVTSIVDGCECVFTYFDESGTCKCAIEKAYKEGKIDFYKPISCHLYPVRLEHLGNGTTAINIHKWKVCKAAFILGRKENLPVYRFLKEPLIRCFGKEWYDKIEEAAIEIEHMSKEIR